MTQFDHDRNRFDRLPDAPRRVLIVANPKAGSSSRRHHIQSLSAELIKRDMQPCEISSLDDLTAEATASLDRGELRAIVAAGGDGTISEVANRTPPGAPITVLPLGTENLLAKYLRIDNNSAALADIITAGHTAWLDAGQANGRIFLLMASVGFDAEVVHRLHELREGNISHWSYVKPILKTIRSYKYPELHVTITPARRASEVADTLTRSASEAAAIPARRASEDPPTPRPSPLAPRPTAITCRWAFIFNLPRYAFGLKFAPDASGIDGQLDLRTFRRGGFFTGLRYLAAVIRGRHQNLADVTAERAASFRIESDEPVLYELDGDPCGNLPLDITCVPRRLRLIVPPGFATNCTR